MSEKISLRLKNNQSSSDFSRFEELLGATKGVESVDFYRQTGQIEIEYDESKISGDKIRQLLGSFSEINDSTGDLAKSSECTYYVKGMHCASCELLIERHLISQPGVKAVEASTSRGRVLIVYSGQRPSLHGLNRHFRKLGYLFFDAPSEDYQEKSGSEKFKIAIIAGSIIIAFYLLYKTGVSSLINVHAKSSLITFLGFGLMAGLSTCAALVGGLVLSMSKQWQMNYGSDASTSKKLLPHILFNSGRLVSYAVLGGVLGAIGNRLHISLGWTSFVVLAVGLLMLALALQMLNVPGFRNFQISLPKSFTRRIADQSRYKGKYTPFTLGALTFFLPCGFTITVQSLALLTGSFWQGMLIMTFFTLGTIPPLLAIGLSSVKFTENLRLQTRFMKVAGIIVIAFALFNINAQFNVLGWPSLSNISINAGTAQTTNNASKVKTDDLPPMVNGKQVVKMNASSSGYSPNNLKVRAGVPVRWEITDTGTSGCTSAVISKSLFNGEIQLTPGQVSVKEFTPQKAGKYKFSCWMGMISGVIEVVDADGTEAANTGIKTASATSYGQ